MPDSFARYLREGATLVLDAVDRLFEPIGRLAASIERQLGTEANVNLYAGWRESPGLDLHWDRHDVLILQVSGKKRWHIYEPTRRFPIGGDVESPPKPFGDPVCIQELSAGDVLYLPRGWWHIAIPCGEPTLHLTVGLHPQTGLDIAMWSLEALKRHEIMRRDVPVIAEPAAQKEYLEELQKALQEVCQDPDLLEKFARHRLVRAQTRPELMLPFAAMNQILPDDETYLIRSVIPRDGAIIETSEGMIEVLFAGKEYKFLEASKVLLDHLDSCATTTIRMFYELFEDRFGEEQLTSFLTELATHGIISFEEPAASLDSRPASA
jgi:ribosomal protein L16 Arg81 hydroxylase